MEPSPSQANSSTVSAKRRPAVLADCFTGDPGLRWCDWLDDFELHAEVNEWDDTQRRQYLALLYRSLTAEEKSSYDLLKSALTSYFEPLDQSELYRTEFRARNKRNDERLLEFAMALRSCASRAFPKMALSQRDLLSRD